MKLILGLLWKEWRSASRLILVLTGGFVLAVCVVSLVSQPNASVRTLPRLVMDSSPMLILLLMPGLLGADAMAPERVQHTDVYMEALPVPKWFTALVKVLFNLLVLFSFSWPVYAVHSLLWRPYQIWFLKSWSSMAAIQLLVFGLCFLSSVIQVHPMRALLRSFLLFFALTVTLAVAFPSLIVLAGVHSGEFGPEGVSGLERLFEAAVILGAILMLAMPIFIERWGYSRSSSCALAGLVALSFGLVMLPACQFWRLWGATGFKALMDAYDIHDYTFLGVAAGLGTFLILAGLALETRNWLGRGIGVAWSETAGVISATGGCVIIGWFCAVSGMAGNFKQDSHQAWMLDGGSSPDRKQLVGFVEIQGFEQNERSKFFYKYANFFYKIESGEAIQLPSAWLVPDEGTGGVWSPDGKYLAWLSEIGDFLERKTFVAVLNTDSLELNTVDLSKEEKGFLLHWKSDSKTLLCLTKGVSDSVRPGGNKRFQFRLRQISVTARRPELKRMIEWEMNLDKSGYNLWTQAMMEDEAEIVVFIRPARRYSEPEYIHGYTLLRINLETGRIRPDPAFERLKKDLKGNFQSDEVSISWDLENRGMEIGEKRLFYAFRLSGPNSPTRGQAWLLGTGGEPNRLLVEVNGSVGLDVFFVDERNYLFTRRKLDEDPSKDVPWEIVKKNLESQEESVVWTSPPSKYFSISTIPLHSTPKWFVIYSQYQEQPTGSWVQSAWLMTWDGVVAEPLIRLFDSFRIIELWPPDDSTFLVWSLDGLGRVDVQGDAQRPSITIRKLLDCKEDPGLSLGWCFCLPCDKSVFIPVQGEVEHGLFEICRVDIQTGERETILRLKGGRWQGAKPVKLVKD